MAVYNRCFCNVKLARPENYFMQNLALVKGLLVLALARKVKPCEDLDKGSHINDRDSQVFCMKTWKIREQLRSVTKRWP